ncbi:N-acetyltransferase [Desulfofundulus thermocisternus]|jgi:amino-acid N-acetyltransferase|uniref:N-acetyltransferase n=1 Tax=Desulfofundulus thermocisternus TaxID=42471 RepID=UPI000487F38C|nr:N-acetyltransferase [Desulfofundulus thermocisternus]MBE3585783.1 N-acetyltransferase [Thermoanaerobacter sp.]MCS5696369.1 N-acetyltransferase [Desulfofundulus thermocisternus]
MNIRKARIADMESVHSLITYYADRGLMLARSRSALYEAVREFTVAEENGQVIGAGSLHIIWEDLAEIRALAVDPRYTRRGIGRRLVQSFLEEARELGLPRVFALTYQAGFFIKCGFQPIAKEKLPQKVWKECINCPKFPSCEEEAVIFEL